METLGESLGIQNSRVRVGLDTDTTPYVRVEPYARVRAECAAQCYTLLYCAVLGHILYRGKWQQGLRLESPWGGNTSQPTRPSQGWRGGSPASWGRQATCRGAGSCGTSTWAGEGRNASTGRSCTHPRPCLCRCSAGGGTPADANTK
eukprot:1155040-Prorocentrum_minimum.AAC.1